MDLVAYKLASEKIKSTAKSGRWFEARDMYDKLTCIFIQDSVVDIGTKYYGNKMATKGRLMFDLQGIFLK